MRKITPIARGGYILIRFTFEGRRYSFNPVPGSKYSDKAALAQAEAIAYRIQQDCEHGYFDPALTKYKPNALGKRSVKDALQDLEEARLVLAERESVNAVNLLNLFEDYAKFKSKTLKSNSMIDYDRIQNKLKKCPYKLAKEATNIMRWLVDDHKGSSTSSLEKTWKLINACCKWAVACQKLQNNPFEGLKKLIPMTKNSGTSEDINPFSRDERERIIDAFKKHKSYSYYASLIEFLFFTGCRPEEALALQWKHIKSSRITFCQKLTAKGEIEAGTKTQRQRSITMSDRVKAVIDSIKSDKDLLEYLVFPAKKGGLIDWHNFANRAWKSVLETLPDIEYRNPYQMRHTCITLMVKDGGDSTLIAKWVGNSPNMIAKRYLGDVSDVKMSSV